MPAHGSYNLNDIKTKYTEALILIIYQYGNKTNQLIPKLFRINTNRFNLKPSGKLN